ncbi:MAG: type II toxin-antitoxin system VapC family toxin [Thermoanaerobaculia bacterium]
MKPELVYLDSSALVKLVVREPESDALRAFLAAHPAAVTSGLAVTEVRRAIARLSPRRGLSDRARLVLDGVALLAVDHEILEKAARLSPPELQTLDAIHIASAFTIRTDLLAFVTYDGRQRAAARKARLPLVHPGS